MKAWIALGSNLNNPKQQIKDACHEIAQLDNVQFISGSKIYISSPIGPQDQDDFINGCILVETLLEPIDLLDALQNIERSHHRTRERHWGPRTLDLDIILIDNQVIKLPRLSVPHPLCNTRLFVLLPLQDIEQETKLDISIFNNTLQYWIKHIHNQTLNTENEYLTVNG